MRSLSMLPFRVFAKFHPRLDLNAAPIGTTPVSFTFVQLLCFQSLTHSLPRRRTRILFPFNHFRTLFTATQSVPPASHSETRHSRHHCTSHQSSEATLCVPRTCRPPVTKSSPYLVTSALSCLVFAKSFPCHTSENSPVSPAIATDPKTPLSKSCICHTSETPRGASNVQTFNPQKDSSISATRYYAAIFQM